MNINEIFTKKLNALILDPKYNDMISELQKLDFFKEEDKLFNYNYLPHNNKTEKLCIHCHVEKAISSHSVSIGQLEKHINATNIYYINSSNPVHLLSKLIISNKYNKPMDADSLLFTSTKLREASTYKGFCKLHDSQLFKNVDGKNLFRDMKNENYHSLKYELLYRTHCWNIAKIEEDIMLYNALNKLNDTNQIFKELWDILILSTLEQMGEKSLNYFQTQIKVQESNKSKLLNYLDIIKIDKNIGDKYKLFINPIPKPSFIGINFIMASNPVTKKAFKKLGFNNAFISGILLFEKQYYSFMLVSKDDIKIMNKYRDNYYKEILMPFLLIYTPENTFVSHNDKEEVANYIINYNKNNKV